MYAILFKICYLVPRTSQSSDAHLFEIHEKYTNKIFFLNGMICSYHLLFKTEVSRGRLSYPQTPDKMKNRANEEILLGKKELCLLDKPCFHSKLLKICSKSLF